MDDNIESIEKIRYCGFNYLKVKLKLYVLYGESIMPIFYI